MKTGGPAFEEHKHPKLRKKRVIMENIFRMPWAALLILLRSAQGRQLYIPGIATSKNNWQKGRGVGFGTISPCYLVLGRRRETAVGPRIGLGSCAYALKCRN